MLKAKTCETVEAGDVVFLAEVNRWPYRYAGRLEAAKTPYTTNQSKQPMYRGWCGETNGRDVSADGMARVLSVREDVARIERLTKADAEEALEELDYLLQDDGRLERRQWV